MLVTCGSALYKCITYTCCMIPLIQTVQNREIHIYRTYINDCQELRRWEMEIDCLEYELSFWGNGKYPVVMRGMIDAQLCEYTKIC